MGAKTITLTQSNYTEGNWLSNPVPGKSLNVDTNVQQAAQYGFKLHNAGQNTPLNNLQPSLSLNYIIKS